MLRKLADCSGRRHKTSRVRLVAGCGCANPQRTRPGEDYLAVDMAAGRIGLCGWALIGPIYFERKPAAIFCADVYGYGRLMGR